MTPPGDGLEFHGSASYLARVRTAPDIDMAIQAALRNRPQQGVVVAGEVREFVLTSGMEKYVVFYTRKGNDVGLTAVYDALDVAKIEARRQDLKMLFDKRRKR
jgi:hypothetical protein